MEGGGKKISSSRLIWIQSKSKFTCRKKARRKKVEKKEKKKEKGGRKGERKGGAIQVRL